MSFFRPFLWPPYLWFLPKRLPRAPLEVLAQHTADGSPLRTLIHVGAHIAQERDAYEALGYTDILWVEGSPKVYRRLVEILNAHHSSNGCRHRAVCALLTDHDGDKVVLRETSNDGMSSSVFPLTDDALAFWKGIVETGVSETVATRTLDSVAEELGLIDRVDTLVVDVQGAELLVLKGGVEVLKRVRGVVSEVSSRRLYEGGVLFSELNAFFKNARLHADYATDMAQRHSLPAERPGRLEA